MVIGLTCNLDMVCWWLWWWHCWGPPQSTCTCGPWPWLTWRTLSWSQLQVLVHHHHHHLHHMEDMGPGEHHDHSLDIRRSHTCERSAMSRWWVCLDVAVSPPRSQVEDTASLRLEDKLHRPKPKISLVVVRGHQFEMCRLDHVAGLAV